MTGRAAPGIRTRAGRSTIPFLALALALAGSARPLPAQTARDVATPGAIQRLIDPIVRGRSAIGVAIYSVERNQPLYLHNADRPLLPASNMKIYTTAAALDRLGPNFQYTTSLYAEGPLLPDGTLRGDLVLVGRGDPALSGRFYGDSATYVFDRFAAALRQQGVRRVTGALVGDASYFDDERVAPGWDSGNLLWWYGARASALSFNDNVVTIVIRPSSRVGEPPIISFTPWTDRLQVVNRAATVGRRGGRSIGIRRSPGIGGYEIWGRIPVTSRPIRYVVAVEDPPLFALSVLRARLARVGIHVAGEERVVQRWSRGVPDRPRRLLASHTSPRMVEIVRIINKHSHNFFAEQVLKTLGAVFEGDGSFDEGGDVVADVVRDAGVAAPTLRIADGSGLSRYNQVTARMTAQLLVAMRTHRWFAEFYDSLLIAGEDGDPRRLNSPAARGNVRSKTGTLRGVSALSGYVTTGDGELLSFSVVSNGLGAKGAAVAVEDAIAERLAGYSVWNSPRLETSTGR